MGTYFNFLLLFKMKKSFNTIYFIELQIVQKYFSPTRFYLNHQEAIE